MLDDWPVWALFAFFFAGAMARGGFTYAIGLGVRRVDQRRAGWLSGQRVARAEKVVGRWGAPAVTLAFLTVGVQSAILAAAGVLRMPLRRFVPALALGAAIWATIYTTIGMAVISAFWGKPTTRWAIAAAAGVLVVWALTSWLRRRVEPPIEEQREVASAAEAEPESHRGR